MAISMILPLRVAQAVMAVVVIGLSGYVAHWYNADTLTSSPSQINFLIFVPLFTFISLLYLQLSPKLLPRASHPYGHLALEVLNTLFYFAGFIALSVFLGKLLFCRGTVCAAARADAVFAAFSWMLWMGSTALLGLEIFKGGLSGMSTDKQAKKAMKEAPVGLGA